MIICIRKIQAFLPYLKIDPKIVSSSRLFCHWRLYFMIKCWEVHYNELFPKNELILRPIRWNFKNPLILFDKCIKTENYLEDIFFSSSFIDDADRFWCVWNLVFQQDNPPAQYELGLKILDCLPYKPDLFIFIITLWE